MAKKVSSMGTLLQWSRSGTPYTTISGVDNLQGPSQSPDVEDVTSLDSPNFYEEIVMGVIRGGEVTFDLFFKPDDPQHSAMQADNAARALRQYRIIFPSQVTKYCYFNAYITKLQAKASVKNPLTESCTLRVTGIITWS